MILHIGNIAPDAATYMTWHSESEFQEGVIGNVTLWVINIHLANAGEEEIDDYGFDIASLIRTKYKSKSPIVLYSPIIKEYFEYMAKTHVKYGILHGAGTYFVDMPFDETEVLGLANENNQLSEACLQDIITTLCDLKGLVTERFNHDLKFEKGKSEVLAVFERVGQFLSNDQKRAIKFDALQDELLEAVQNNNPTTYLDLKRQLVLLCNRHISPSKDAQLSPAANSYKVLVIDDQADELDKITAALGSEFEVVSRRLAQEALEILDKDVSNEIMAVITDWRLYADAQQNYWQALQGYDILKYAATKGFRALFALTSQPEPLVHQIRNRLGINFHLFKKENVLNDRDWSLFKDLLADACREASSLRAAMLHDSKHWTRRFEKKGVPQPTLEELYIEMWNSADRERFLKVEVEVHADKMWDHLETDSKRATLYKFNVALPNKQSLLVPVLRLRRIWLALWFAEMSYRSPRHAGDTSELVIDIFRKMFTAGDLHGRKDPKGSADQVVHLLCINLDHLKDEVMLPEERDWLIRKGLLTTP